MGNPIADQIHAEYRLEALPPPDPGEWRFIAADGRPVRVFDITGRPGRPQLAHIPPASDRCGRCGRQLRDRTLLRPAWRPLLLTLCSVPIPTPMHCADCRALRASYRPRVIYEFHWDIAPPVIDEVRR